MPFIFGRQACAKMTEPSGAIAFRKRSPPALALALHILSPDLGFYLAEIALIPTRVE